MPAPGVVVTTSTNPGSAGSGTIGPDVYFIVTQTERGIPNIAHTIRSMAEYQQKLGAQVPYGAGYFDLVNFFQPDCGKIAKVCRVVGAAATTGNLTLVDRAGSPLSTLLMTASSPGAWSSQVSVQVANGQVANTFTITVFLNGVSVRKYANLASPAAAVTAMAQDPYLVVTQIADVTTAPNNNPAVISATPLSAGSDDRASINTGVYTAGLTAFKPALGTGVVAIPGQPIDNVGAALLAHCVANGRIFYSAPAQGSSASSVQASAAALVGTAGSEYGGVFYPWVQETDGFGNLITISPEGFVAGQRAKAINTVGVWQAPANTFGLGKNLLGTELAIDDATGATLDQNNVNAIRILNGLVTNYGYDALSTDAVNYPLLSDRDFLNYVAWGVTQILQPYVWLAVDGLGQFFAKMNADIKGFLESIRTAGGLWPSVDINGNQIDPGYLIDVGPDVNPAVNLAQNIVAAKVEVRKSPTAKLINVGIVKAALTAAL